MKTISADEEQYHYRKWKDGWSLKQGQISVGLSIWGLTENVFYFSWTPSLLQTPSIIQIIVSRRPNFAFSLNLGQMLFFLIHPSPQMTGFGPFDSEISTMSTVWKWTPTISFTTAVSASSFWFWVKTRTFFAETSQSPSGCLLHIWRNSLEMTLRLTDDPKTRRLCPQLSPLQTNKNNSVVLNSSFRVYLRLWFKCQRQKCVCVCSSLVFQVSSFCPAQLHLIFLTT